MVRVGRGMSLCMVWINGTSFQTPVPWYMYEFMYGMSWLKLLYKMVEIMVRVGHGMKWFWYELVVRYGTKWQVRVGFGTNWPYAVIATVQFLFYSYLYFKSNRMYPCKNKTAGCTWNIHVQHSSVECRTEEFCYSSNVIANVQFSWKNVSI